MAQLPKASQRRATPARPDPAEAAKLLQLIGAAEDIFLQKGYHTATMSDVAKAAGMSKKTVYQLIDSKAELFAVLLAHHQNLLNFPVPQPGWTAHKVRPRHLIVPMLRNVLAQHPPSIARKRNAAPILFFTWRLTQYENAQLRSFKRVFNGHLGVS